MAKITEFKTRQELPKNDISTENNQINQYFYFINTELSQLVHK